jgi:hypothetical protein
MSKFRPMSRWDRFCAGELPFELALAVGATVAPALTGARFLTSEPKSPVLAAIAFVATGIVCIGVVWRAIVRNTKARNASELHALDGVLHALHAILTASSPGSSLCICAGDYCRQLPPNH